MCDQRELSTYERRQIELIETWMSSPPSYAARGIRAAKGVAGSLVRRVLPNGVVEKIGARATLMSAVVQRAIPTGAIEGAVNANLWLAHQWTREKAVLRELGIETFENVKDLNLEQLDRLANKVHNAAIGAGGAAGAVGGAGGVVLAVPSVVAIINLTMRTIRQIGLCYGYRENDHIERACMLEVLGLVGGGGEQGAKMASAKFLQETLVMVKRTTFKKMAEKAAAETALKEAFILQSREVAKQLGFRLTKSRIQASIPVLGGGVGLFLDGNYMRSVGWTARHYYQRRWLQDRGLWPDIIDVAPDEGEDDANPHEE